MLCSFSNIRLTNMLQQATETFITEKDHSNFLEC